MPSIALVTARAALALDDDLKPLAAALGRSGAAAEIQCWDDASLRWERFDAAVLRSAWDYPDRLDEFLAWARRTSDRTLLLNPMPIVEWNVDKEYLEGLASAGVPTVPTSLLRPGAPMTFPDSDEIVVKPSVSAGSRDTARFVRGDPAAGALVHRIWASGRTAMVQPYLTRIDAEGERAIVCFDGSPSHAFTKGAILRPGEEPTADLFAAEEITPATASEAERATAVAAIDAIRRRTGVQPLYARIDLVPGPDGEPLVLEAELIEPSVYHHTDPTSAGRFAAAILGRLRVG